MKKAGGILYGIGMAFLWCAVLKSPVGILLGISMGLCMTAVFNSSGKKEETDQEGSENSESDKL